MTPMELPYKEFLFFNYKLQNIVTKMETKYSVIKYES